MKIGSKIKLNEDKQMCNKEEIRSDRMPEWIPDCKEKTWYRSTPNGEDILNETPPRFFGDDIDIVSKYHGSSATYSAKIIPKNTVYINAKGQKFAKLVLQKDDIYPIEAYDFLKNSRLGNSETIYAKTDQIVTVICEDSERKWDSIVIVSVGEQKDMGDNFDGYHMTDLIVLDKGIIKRSKKIEGEIK